MILEVSSIVLGVLLALGVSEWQEEREKDEMVVIALGNIHRELEANHKILTTIHDNNIKTVEVSTRGDDIDAKFIPGLQVRSTAWEALLSSGISNHVDYLLLFDLSAVYSIQSIYRETGMKLIDSSMFMTAMATVNHVEVENDYVLKQFMDYFELIVTMETGLLQDYVEALEKTKSFDPADDTDPVDADAADDADPVG
jgi:hypothetical protein